MRGKIDVWAAGLLLGTALLAMLLETGNAVYTWVQTAAEEKYTIVIDPGHGGNDPGKIGVNQAQEKDINLAIALQLRSILEQNDCRVILTRERDEGLYQESDSSKKTADLRARCQCIDGSGADVAVSIHQNSFTSESSQGAQVFYQSASAEGKRLAETLQNQLVSGLDPSNHRKAKANHEYYLLKNTRSTMVIVECGFLSNPQEAALLTTETYQRRVAWTVALGILQYLSGGQKQDADNHTKDQSGEISGGAAERCGQDFAGRRTGGISDRDSVWTGRGCVLSGGFGKNICSEGAAV